MKKITRKLFAPIAVLALAVGVSISVNNQKGIVGAEAALTYVTENFEAQKTLTASYADGSFDGADGITFSFGHSRNEDTFGIVGKGIMLRRASDSYLEFTLQPGLAGLKFQYRKAFTGTSKRQLEVLVNDEQVTTTPTFGTSSGADTTIYDLIYEPAVSHSGPSTVKIKNVGTTSTNRQTVIDNLQWSYTVSADAVTALSVNPTSKTYFTTDKLLASDFAVTITKNGAAGTSSDYTAKIGTGTGATFTGTDIVWGTTQPTTADTTIQFKSKYPDVAGGSTYLTADVSLTVNVPLLDSISVTTQPTKKTYNTNDEFDPTGMVVTALYNNGASQTISNSSLSFSPSPLTQGTTTVTISYTEGSVTKTTTVSGLSVTSSTFYSATLAYPKGAGTTNMTSGNNASSVGLNPNIFEVLSNTRLPNPLLIGLNKDGEVRLYSGTEKGSVLTVNLQETYNNYVIKSLTFTFGKSVAPALIKANDVEIHNGDLTANSTLTFNHLYASSFSIENIGTAQIYILSVNITYLTHEQAALDFADNVMNGVGNNANGSCAEAYQELNGIYNALSTESKSIYNDSTDELFVNAKARMAYLQAWVDSNGTSSIRQVATNDTNNVAAVALIGVIGLTTLVGYYFINKKKLTA